MFDMYVSVMSVSVDDMTLSTRKVKICEVARNLRRCNSDVETAEACERKSNETTQKAYGAR